ncbi:Alpha-mannosidase 2x [Mizuhopecten yessoensis]|uniref:Alpha-mannosidase n=2 Tax=Mizuhopecten yessoensis TaxID=6573 RepID=A0A210PHI3_MIZYE|nr:Alpha-mannosidase 2x [Mizuhopecten yessoensis]
MMKCRKRALLSLIVAVLFLIFKLLIWLTQREKPIHPYMTNHPDLQIRDLPLQATKIDRKSTRGKVRARSRVSKDIMDDDVKDNKSSVPDQKEGRVLVLIVPHSHTDPGWLQTLQEYYNTKVKNILDLAVSKLTVRTDMTFIWSETIFLHMWWKEADSVKRSMLKKLVHDGRFEIVAGGWVMPDQAVTHYKALLIQLQIAHEWLTTEFQVSPKVAWSIDPFGHSPTLPYLWSQTGYKLAVTQRVSQKYKSVMASRRQLEFTWRQQWDKAGKTDLFCHVPPYKLYNIEQACGPDPSVCLLLDIKAMPVDLTQVIHKDGTESVIDNLISAVAHQLRKKAANYNHDVVILPLGDDFRYDTDLEWDKMHAVLDIIITYINNNPKFNMMMKYGTLKDYLAEVKNQYNTSGSPLYTGDFLPYTDNGNDYWTGFYSSRPEQKRAIRELQETFHAGSVWNSLSPLTNSRRSRDEMEHVAWTVSLMQHHDAITGTSKAAVVGDYRSRAREDRDLARAVICNSVEKIVKSKSDQESSVNGEEIWKYYEFSLNRPQLLTFSSRTIWYIVFVNSLTQPRHEVISFVIDTSDVSVTNNFGTRVAAQVNPSKESDQAVSFQMYVLQIPVFIEFMSIAIYTISRTATNASGLPHTNIAVRNNHLNAMPFNVFNRMDIKDDLRLSNSYIAAVFCPVNGSLMYVYLKDSDTKIAVRSELLVYNSSRKSGAYIFAPLGDAHNIFSSLPGIFIASGQLSQQIEVTYTGVTLTYSLYNTEGPNAKVIHVTCRVNVNIPEMSDLELILRFVTNIDSRGILYTDNNGFQHTKRKYRRDTPIAANYYPMATDAVIQDSSARFTVHASHAHGVASLHTGELEIMLDRRPTSDDGRGLGQGMMYSNAHVDMLSLQFEKCSTENKRMCISKEMFLPTLDSILINDYLQCPIITIQSNSQYQVKTFKLLSEKLPIDTTIVTMKKKRISSDQLSLRLVLHRRGTVKSGLGNTRDHPINLWSLVKDMYILYVRETSLTFLETKRALQPGEKVYLEPMTMTAFEIGLMTV